MIKVKTQEELKNLWDADDGETIHPDEANKAGIPECYGLLMKVTAFRAGLKSKTTGEMTSIDYLLSSNAVKQYILAQIKNYGYDYLKTLKSDDGLFSVKDGNWRPAYLVHYCGGVVYATKEAKDFLESVK
ncbi:hypothetical protein AGMMS50268_07670 [Spirochaetia bacterium]|nr:hypothetical protein AGMMS50268_07670 [Spirochaetia bacterium]